MAFNNILLRRRSRPVWADPVRKVRTLESFSQTETDGGQDILATAKRVSDPKLRDHLERHAADEMRHGDMFRRRAQELREQLTQVPDTGNEPDKLYDLANQRPGLDVDSHGFLSLEHFDELGEIAYVAMLHAAEVRAANLFAVHNDLTRDSDPETAEVFAKILKDEQYHVSWTKNYLKKWRDEGRVKEVKDAETRVSESNFMSAWKRLGARSGEKFSRFVMFVLYFTLVLPFALLSKLSTSRLGWRDSLATSALDQSRSQY